MEFNDGLPLDGSSCLLLPDQIRIWSVGSLPSYYVHFISVHNSRVPTDQICVI